MWEINKSFNASELYSIDHYLAVRTIEAISAATTTVAGSPDDDSSCEGGLAINARLNVPLDIFPDQERNLFIADLLNYSGRKVDKVTGTFTKVPGNGTTWNGCQSSTTLHRSGLSR
ncbi:MAG: hypothetical protein H7Y31_08155 [Chitinophagaceae bacterium]|nr:hypothetical protein [Chitinophagaceae bacterium]